MLKENSEHRKKLEKWIQSTVNKITDYWLTSEQSKTLGTKLFGILTRFFLWNSYIFIPHPPDMIQGVPENMRHAYFFILYMRPYQ